MKCPNCGHKMVYEDETEDGKVIKEPYYWCYFCQSGWLRRIKKGKINAI